MARPDGAGESGGDRITGVVVTTNNYEWTGAQNTNFANANNWDYASAGINPATTAPGTSATARFDGAGGTITGTGTVGQLDFAGTGQWVVNGASLASVSGFTDTGILSLRNGGTIQNLGGNTSTIEGTGATVIVTGSGSEFEAGTGTVQAYGPNMLTVGGSIAGTLDILSGGLAVADDVYIGAAGSVLVQGTNSALDAGQLDDIGTLSVAGGATVAAISLGLGLNGSNAKVVVDSGSGILLGAGSVTAGALTVGTAENNYSVTSLYGVGTIAANLVNNGDVSAEATSDDVGVTLEITGSVTGTGRLGVNDGYFGIYNNATYASPAAVLQLDSAVGAGQTIDFYAYGNVGSATLILRDPSGFLGTISGFNVIGEAIDLIGDTIASAAISGSTLGVTLVGGATLDFNVAANSQSSFVQASGSVITVAAPPVYSWTGATNTNFGSASNWQNVTSTPKAASSAPNATEIAEFLTVGGTITGTGDAATVVFAGSRAWTVGSNADLIGSQVSVEGTVSIGTASTLASGNTLFVGNSAAGDLQAVSGSKIVAGTLFLGGNGNLGTIAVDATSSVEIGAAGTGQSGAITVDSWNATLYPQLIGVGLISGNLVDNNFVEALAGVAGETLEVTGSVSGSGNLYIQGAEGSISNGTTTTYQPAATLRLDSAVAAGVQVGFTQENGGLSGGTLVLADPTAFAGVLNSFTSVGDTLVLPGESLTAASISNNALQVTLAAGGVQTFALSSTPASDLLQVNGSVLSLASPPTLQWTGADGTTFGNAGNWDDVTDGINPSPYAPTASSIAEFDSAGGTVSGTGSASVLDVDTGTWTFASSAGISVADGMSLYGTEYVQSGATLTNSGAELSIDTGTLAVSGTLTSPAEAVQVGSTGTALLSAVNGGSVVLNSVYLGNNLASGTLAVDSTSMIDVGTAGTGAVGAITVDPNTGTDYSGIQGVGTIVGNVVDNNWIIAQGESPAAQLEITGTVSGSGLLDIANGYTSISGGTVITVPGGTLQLDSAVSGVTVNFFVPNTGEPGGTLRLLKPSTFHGIINAFDNPGDTLVLVGQTIEAASVQGSNLDVTLASGGTLTFGLASTPTSTLLQVVNSSSIVVISPPTDVWTGASSTNFGTAGNWDDITNNLDPAGTAPSPVATVEFLSGGGTITGTGSVASLLFGGTAPWVIGNGGSLSSTNDLTVNGMASIAQGAVVSDAGTLSVGGTTSATATLAVTGALSLSGSTTEVGTGGNGLLEAVNGGTIVASSLELGGNGYVGTLAVDARSGILIGYDAGPTNGVITISEADVGGDGTIVGAVALVGDIDVYSQQTGNTLEITGALSGSGGIYIDPGYSIGTGTTTYAPGGVLQLDASVSAGQYVYFVAPSNQQEAGAIRLLDPTAFAATISGFDCVGEQLILPGQTLTSAVLNGSTLQVGVAGGGSFDFAISDVPSDTAFSVSGSVVTVVPSPVFTWIGASGTNFGTAANWDDVTDGHDPALSAPGASAIAELLSSGGTVTGTGSVSQLLFGGSTPWTIAAGASLSDSASLTVNDDVSIASSAAIISNGSVLVAGTASASATLAVSGLLSTGGIYPIDVGTSSGGGLLTAVNGGTILAAEISLGDDNGDIGTLSVDAASNIVIGSGVGQSGAVSVLSRNSSSELDSSITGDGMIAANLINDSVIYAGDQASGNTLEVTGNVSGNGWIYAENGYTSVNNGTTTYIPGAVVQFDGAVDFAQNIYFDSAYTPQEAPAVSLLDPGAFSGTLDAFSAVGDRFILPGQTVTSVVMTGSTLDVDTAGGGSYAFSLGDVPGNTAFSASGSVITVATAPVYVWTGATGSRNFGAAGNWNDTTDGSDPAITAPGSSTITQFLSGGGTIASTGAVSQILFAGTSPWVLGNGANLSDSNGLTVNDAVLINAGATLSSNSSVSVNATTSAAASLTVSGLLNASDSPVGVGTANGPGLLAAVNGGTILAEEVSLGSDRALGTLSADAASIIVIGSGAIATAGAVCLDGDIYGDGTIVANLVNDGWIYAYDQAPGNTLEITGTVSGSGWINAEGGSSSIDNGTTTYLPGAVVQFDGAVGSGQNIDFNGAYAPQAQPAVSLLDPGGFDGTLWNFDSIGNQLILPGQTVTSAAVIGSTLYVGVAGGGLFAFAVDDTPVNTVFTVSGSVITVVNTPIDVWTGALGTNVGTAGNWNDIANNVTPATVAPNSAATAEFLAGGGTITGTGSVYDLQFDGTGPWTLANGASLSASSGLTINGMVTIGAGATLAGSESYVQIAGTASPTATVAVSGLLSLADSQVAVGGSSGNGLLAAFNGGTITAGSVDLGGSASVGTLAADATSSILIGSAASATAGAVTVVSSEVYGNGVIAANLLNNGWIYPDAQTSGDTLEVTGSVSGSGWFYLDAGSNAINNGVTTAVPGSVLQLDGAVGSGQYIDFATGETPQESTTLRLLDPSGFQGILDGFSGAGDELVLPGQTITSARLNNSTLDVYLANGGSFAFADSSYAQGVAFSATGSTVTVVAAPIDAWTGAVGTDFGTASNWDDIQNKLNPSAFAPGPNIPAEFLSNGGTITGSGSASELFFTGSSPWFLTNGGSISTSGSLVDQATLTVEGGATISTSSFGTVAGSMALSTAVLNVTGNGSCAQVEYLYVGDSGAGMVSVTGGGTLFASGFAEITNGTIAVSGTNSDFSTGDLELGDNGTGTFSVANGATVSANIVDIGYQSEATGVVTVTGGSSVKATTIHVGGQGAGTLTVGSSACVGASGELWNEGSITITGGTLVAGTIAGGSGTSIEGFGTILGSTITDSGTIVAQGGLLTLTGPVGGSGNLQIDAVATLEVAGSVTTAVVFAGTGGTLRIDQPANFNAAISGFTNGDTIDLAGVSASSAMVNNGTLTVGLAGGGALTYDVTGLPANCLLGFVADGAGGTDLTDTALTIAGAMAGQNVIAGGAIPLLSGVTVTDPNIGQTDTVTVTLSSTSNGTLAATSLGIGSYNASTGVYTVTGGAAAVTTALDGLVFDPSGAGNTRFTVTDTDSVGQTATDSTTSVIAANGPQVVNGTSDSYVYTDYPIATASQTIQQYSGSNGTGTLVSDIVDNTSGTSYLIAYNPTSGVTRTTQQWSSFDGSGGAPSGQVQSDVVNYTDGQTLVYAYFYPTGSTKAVTQTAELWSSTDLTTGAAEGTPLSDVVNYSDGTTLVYAYNPQSGVAQTTTEWSATNVDGSAAGYKISAVVDNTSGTAIVYAYQNPSGTALAGGDTQTAAFYSSYNAESGAPIGNPTAISTDYTPGMFIFGSSITAYDSSGYPTKTTFYSGPDASGFVISSTTYALPPITAGSDSGVISITGTGQVVDPGFGSNSIQFLSGASDDTLVLHTGGTDTISGFDPSAGDMLDLRPLFSESGIDLTCAAANLSAYITVTAAGSDAAVLFDPTGQGGGSTVATLTDDASLVPLLKAGSAFVV